MAIPSDATRITSALIRSIVPGFVENDYPTFVLFLEAYYEWMEQQGNTLGETKRLLSYRDVDDTLDEFITHFRKQYLSSMPTDLAIEPATMIRYAKALYQQRGSEAAARLMFRIAFDQDIDVYYPREDVLRMSDGTWVRSVSIKAQYTDDVEQLVGTTITGETSGASGYVENINVYFEGDYHVAELFFNSDTLRGGDFTIGETVSNSEGVETVTLGIVTGIVVNSPGTDYTVGDRVVFGEGLLGGGGVGASAEVSRVAAESVTGITIQSGGEGYVVGDDLQFFNTGTGGSGAAGVVSQISAGNLIAEDEDHYTVEAEDGLSYRIQLEDIDYYLTSLIIEPYLGVLFDAADYDTASHHELSEANAASSFEVTQVGIENPFLVDGIQTPYGVITRVQLTASGSGYQRRPVVTVENETAIQIEEDEGIDIYTAASLIADAGAGQVKTIKVTSPGVGYVSAPPVSLANSGDGNALVTATVGVLNYSSGYYTDTNGQLSADKYLEDEHYYQPYSYVIKVNEAIATYRSLVKRLLHPAGSIFFGEYHSEDVMDLSVGITTTVGRTGSSGSGLEFLLSQGTVLTSNTLHVTVVDMSLDANTVHAEGLYRHYGRTVEADNPMAWFPLDGGTHASEATLDSNGVVTFATHGPAADGEGAVVFNGSNTAYAFTGLEITTGFASDLWFFANTAPATTEVLMETVWGSVLWTANSTVQFQLYSGDTVELDVDPNEWHYVMCSWDGTTDANGMMLVVDRTSNTATSTVEIGEAFVLTFDPEAFTGDDSFDVLSATGFLSYGSTGDYFTGRMTKVALYDHALSFQRSQDHYEVGRTARWSGASKPHSGINDDMIYAYADIPMANTSAYRAVVLNDEPVGYWHLNEAGYARQVMASTPVAYYRLDDQFGTSAGDSSGNGNNGTYVGGVTLNQTGALSDGTSGITLDGSTGYITTPITRSNAAPFSAEVWFKFTGNTTGGYAAILSGNDANFFVGKTSGNTNIGVQDGGFDGSVGVGTSAFDGNWHHLVYTHASGNGSVYLDGTLVGSKPFIGGTGNIWIGRENESTGYYFTGSIDDAAFYNRALTATEIAAHYAARTQTDSEVTAQVTDSSGNDLHLAYQHGMILNQTGALNDSTPSARPGANSNTEATLVDADLAIGGPLSVEVWAKQIAGSSDAGLAGTGYNTGYQLNWHAGTTIYFYVGNGGSHVTGSLSDTTSFHHIVGTWDGTTATNGLKLYIDGVLVNQATSAFAAASITSQTFRIGRNSTSFNGTIDEVAVYDRVLTADEIAAHYDAASEQLDGFEGLESEIGDYFMTEHQLVPAQLA